MLEKQSLIVLVDGFDWKDREKEHSAYLVHSGTETHAIFVGFGELKNLLVL
jgi:hypothetical protein